MTNEIDSKIQRLEDFIQTDNKAGALQLLLDLVTFYAQKKDFRKAETFRDKLYDIDPMAISEIVRANEILAAEKNQGIDPVHKEVWSRLYESLTVEDGNALYYAFEEITVPPDEYIFRQGEVCASLFFVVQGMMKAACQQGPREVLIGQLGPGSVIGVDTFFSNSICTTSVSALTTSKLSKLDKSALATWQPDSPGIEAGLKRFCLKNDAMAGLRLKRGMDRRSEVRKKLRGMAAIQFLDNAGALIGKPLRAELGDISSGGLSFLFKIPSSKKARHLLGRWLVIQLRSAVQTHPFKIQKKGIIVAVTPQPFDDYLFHVRLDSNLSIHSLESILKVLAPRKPSVPE